MTAFLPCVTYGQVGEILDAGQTSTSRVKLWPRFLLRRPSTWYSRARQSSVCRLRRRQLPVPSDDAGPLRVCPPRVRPPKEPAAEIQPGGGPRRGPNPPPLLHHLRAVPGVQGAKEQGDRPLHGYVRTSPLFPPPPLELEHWPLIRRRPQVTGITSLSSRTGLRRTQIPPKASTCAEHGLNQRSAFSSSPTLFRCVCVIRICPPTSGLVQISPSVIGLRESNKI